MRIDEEHGEQLSVARFSGIREFEGLHAVLENVGEGEEAMSTCRDAAEVKDAWFFVGDAIVFFDGRVFELRRLVGRG